MLATDNISSVHYRQHLYAEKAISLKMLYIGEKAPHSTEHYLVRTVWPKTKKAGYCRLLFNRFL